MQYFSTNQGRKVHYMEHRQPFIPEEAVRFCGNIKMEQNRPLVDVQDLLNTEGYAVDPSKIKIAINTMDCSDTNNANEIITRNIHIPYILNGELFEIQTQDGENVTVKCCHCPPDRVYRGSVRSTGNFHMHIKRRHPDLMGKIYDMKVNALVERRDRFLKNRKTTRRRNVSTNRNRRHSSVNGQRITHLAQPSSELFKLKAAFQRHQQQQQIRSQQDELKENQLRIEQHSGGLNKWNMVDHFFVASAMERAHNNTQMGTYNEQPLNYSLKQCANEGTVANINYAESAQEIIIKDADTPLNSHTNEVPIASSIDNEQITEYGILISPDLQNTQGITQSNEHVLLHPSNSDQSLYGRATTLSAVTPCPSDVSSYGASPNAKNIIYGMSSNNLGTIKNELFPNEAQPIDLSVHPSSSGLSGCSGYGSGLDTTHSTWNRRAIGFKDFEGLVKFDEILVQAVSALHSLQREVQSYNQTNNNWLRLEVAKFKFLHPEFQFPC